MEGADWTAVIIEDDPDVRDLIDLVLSQSGFRTILAEDGLEGVDAVRTHNPLITTLDVNMPGMDGFAVAKRLREFSNTYLIFITALGDEIDVVTGFEAGADDYLVKPFRPRELRARADSMLRRPRDRSDVASTTSPGAPPSPPVEETWAQKAAREFADESPRGGSHAARPVDPAPPAPSPQPAHQPPTYQQAPVQPAPAPAPVQPPPVQQPVQQPAAQQTYLQPVPGQPVPPVAAAPGGPAADGSWIRFNGLALNNETRIVTVDGGSVDLTRTEFDLLASLLSTGRRVRSKADLVLTMRGQQYVTSYFVNEADKRSVEVHVANLRRKIGDDSTNPKFIETVRGVGYRLAESL
ncbi:response regulator transcription factor [uncultured Nocardioides sp.]|jgi:two-component system OmpR family response regulator|uniref:response regulator transcription factor n=1 Tax=uncultured Nocardioides sp. TaxID=198441 RepID=UPI00261710C6|nr:response regulator transcription factor [uncultured Nocardioides sp.]